MEFLKQNFLSLQKIPYSSPVILHYNLSVIYLAALFKEIHLLVHRSLSRLLISSSM